MKRPAKRLTFIGIAFVGIGFSLSPFKFFMFFLEFLSSFPCSFCFAGIVCVISSARCFRCSRCTAGNKWHYGCPCINYGTTEIPCCITPITIPCIMNCRTIAPRCITRIPECLQNKPIQIKMIHPIIPHEAVEVNSPFFLNRIPRGPSAGYRVIETVSVVRNTHGLGLGIPMVQRSNSQWFRTISSLNWSRLGHAAIWLKTEFQGASLGFLIQSRTPSHTRMGTVGRKWRGGGHHWLNT